MYNALKIKNQHFLNLKIKSMKVGDKVKMLKTLTGTDYKVDTVFVIEHIFEEKNPDLNQVYLSPVGGGRNVTTFFDERYIQKIN